MRTLLIGLFLLFLPTSVFAQDNYTIYKLPPGRRVVTAQDTYQCFNLGEYKQLLLIDEELRAGDELIENGKKALEELSSQKSLYLERVSLAEEESSKVSTRLAGKTKEFEKLSEAYVAQNEKLVRMRKLVMYTVAGAALAIGGVAAGVWLSHAN